MISEYNNGNLVYHWQIFGYYPLKIAFLDGMRFLKVARIKYKNVKDMLLNGDIRKIACCFNLEKFKTRIDPQ